MSWDPNQGGQVPQQPTPSPNPYETPASPTPPPANPYQPPANPYGPGPQPSTNPYGYGQPAANPYMPPTSYGWQPGTYPPPVTATPLPLGQAVRELPNQYLRVASHPSAETFVQELGKASWDIVWVQLLGFAALFAIITFFTRLATSALLVSILPSLYTSLVASANVASSLLSSLIYFVSLIGGFFLLQGLIHLLAKAFSGQGTFLQQCYSGMLSYGPVLTILLACSIIGIIPFVNILALVVELIAGIYGIVLLVFATMASQRLQGGPASAAVLIPIGGLMVLACCGILGLVALIAATLRASY
ncbi:Yip1 family protein [Thermogemmatispora carboxidivorans]|uniref:Yip1 family protein n=1 Tax=Thermogemmatispora carboxidivorans TaxID=1382306 RepID=UPI00069B86BD|nr:Yip1 family protein [Thermogemmatispora carboxidivorans]